MSPRDEPVWADAGLRAKVAALAGRVLAGEDPEPAAMELWRLSLSATGDYVLAEGLWNIWGRITALAAAAELRDVLGDESQERAHCDRWIYERLDIVP